MNNFQLKKDNIFYKSAVSLLKIIVLVVLAYLFLAKIVFAENKTQFIIGLFVLIFITLPTIFIIFFKKNFFRENPASAKIWKIYRVIYVIFIVLYIALWIFGTWHLNEVAKTQKAVDFIKSQKITLDDVMGKNLPPVPDQKINDSTIAGIDANKNNIRDDVELVIFKEYPNSAKIRAAELQYAETLQLELTQVSNSATLVASMQKDDLAFDCLGYSGPDTSLSAAKNKEQEIKNIVLNTDLRKNRYSDEYNKYMTSYASLSSPECDIELSSLPN